MRPNSSILCSAGIVECSNSPEEETEKNRYRADVASYTLAFGRRFKEPVGPEKGMRSKFEEGVIAE